MLTIIRPYPFQRSVGMSAWNITQVIDGVRKDFTVLAANRIDAISQVRNMTERKEAA